MKWILFVLWQALPVGSPTITVVEFDDVSACVFAEQALRRRVRGSELTTLCLPKATPPEGFPR